MVLATLFQIALRYRISFYYPLKDLLWFLLPFFFGLGRFEGRILAFFDLDCLLGPLREFLVALALRRLLLLAWKISVENMFVEKKVKMKWKQQISTSIFIQIWCKIDFKLTSTKMVPTVNSRLEVDLYHKFIVVEVGQYF